MFRDFVLFRRNPSSVRRSSVGRKADGSRQVEEADVSSPAAGRRKAMAENLLQVQRRSARTAKGLRLRSKLPALMWSRR